MINNELFSSDQRRNYQDLEPRMTDLTADGSALDLQPNELN